MNPDSSTSPRRRLQALLAVPESQRTDAQWDEINDLEIQLAPGNRQDAGERPGRRDGAAKSRPPERTADVQRKKRPMKKFRKKPPEKKAQ